MSVPVYKRGDNVENSNCIAVLQLINKHDGNPFDEYNAEEAGNFCHCLGDIVQNISKVEQLMNYKNLLEHLDKFVEKTCVAMQNTTVVYDSLKKGLKDFRKRIRIMNV